MIVEDGSSVANSNSYVSEADFQAWLTARGYTLTGTAAINLTLAMDYLQTQVYLGVQSNLSQSLMWPRTGVYIDGMAVASNEIPTYLKIAQMQTAWSIDQGENPMATTSPGIKREKVDSLEIEYQDGSGKGSNVAVVSSLSKLLANSGAAFRAGLVV